MKILSLPRLCASVNRGTEQPTVSLSPLPKMLTVIKVTARTEYHFDQCPMNSYYSLQG